MKKKSNRRFFAGCLLFGLIILAAGCSPAASLPSQSEVFKPPTQPAALNTPAGTAVAPVSSQPQPTPPCTNGLAFLSDITIPDGTLVAPGASIEKTWEVENIGTCGWNEAYSLRLVGGSNLGAETSLPLYPARAGSRARIDVTFTAPSESGTIHSAWRAYAPDGQPFGDPIYLQIIVSNSQP